jgi:hypothetical protein
MGAVKRTMKPAGMYFSGALGAILVASEVVALLEIAAVPGAEPATPISQPVPEIVFRGISGPDNVVRPSDMDSEARPMEFVRP